MLTLTLKIISQSPILLSFYSGTNALINAQQARVSGQLGALAEGVGTLIKEIRELKTMKSIENAQGGAGGAGGGSLSVGGSGGAGNLQGLLAAATVGKALNAIRNAQSALNIGAGNVMGQSFSGAASTPAFTTGFRAGGAAGYGGIGLGALAGGLGGGLSVGFGGIGGPGGLRVGSPIPLPVQSPMVSFNALNAGQALGQSTGIGAGGSIGGLSGGQLADSLSTSLSALGPKAASHFLNNLAKGMNKVTTSYLSALKKQQKEQKSSPDDNKNSKGKKGKQKASKRGVVILPARMRMAESLGQKYEEESGIRKMKNNDLLTALLGEKRSKTKKNKNTDKKMKGRKRADKRKISKQEKSDQNDALLAQKALGVSFGNGLKPSKLNIELIMGNILPCIS